MNVRSDSIGHFGFRHGLFCLLNERFYQFLVLRDNANGQVRPVPQGFGGDHSAYAAAADEQHLAVHGVFFHRHGEAVTVGVIADQLAVLVCHAVDGVVPLCTFVQFVHYGNNRHFMGNGNVESL